MNILLNCANTFWLMWKSYYAIHRHLNLFTVIFIIIPGFITKGCLTILVPVLKYIFHFSVFQKHFPTQWKQAVIVPVYMKHNNACVQNYTPTSLLNNASKVFVWTCYYFICKLKSKSTLTNLVSYLDYTTPLMCSQHQVYAIYFDLSSAFDLVLTLFFYISSVPMGCLTVMSVGSIVT
jgi:hypothetical protein